MNNVFYRGPYGSRELKCVTERDINHIKDRGPYGSRELKFPAPTMPDSMRESRPVWVA